MDPEQRPLPDKALIPVESRVIYRDSQPNPSAEDDAESSGLDFKALLRALRRRWLLALTLAVVLAPAATAAAWFLVPTRHTARTLLYVESKQPSILFNFNVDPSHGNYQRTQLALVKSRLVLNAALRQKNVADLPTIRAQPNAVEWLEKHITADYKLAPEIMTISLTGEQPDDIVAMLNAVRETYLQEVVEKEQNDRRVHLEQLKKLFADYDNILRDKRRTLRDLAQQVGSGNSQVLVTKHKFALERLAMAQRDLLQLQSDLRKAMVDVASQHARQKVAEKIRIPEAAVRQALKRDPVVQQHEKEIAKVEQLLDETRRLSARGDSEPSLAGFRARLEAAQKSLADRQEHLRPLVLKELRQQAQDEADVRAAQAEGRISLLTELEKSVTKDVEQMSKENGIINKGSLDIESLHEELSQTEDVAKKISTQAEALKVELQAPSRVRLLEEATVNADNAQKRRMMAAGGSGLGILLLTLFGVAWLEQRARRISTPDDVKLGTGMRLVGTLPAVSAKESSGFDGTGQPGRESPGRRLLLESIDHARTFLLHAARSEQFKAVMITSATSGEGKTSVSSQLAASMARGGFRTLLIDGDLRRPMLHRLLGLPQGPGLCEVLRAEASIDQVIQHTALPGLSLISAGYFDHTVLKALARQKGKAVFDGLKRRYDLVVVDSTPVLPVADALLLGRYVDGVIFSILRDVSRMPALLAACERIATLGIRTLGAVVAGVHASAYYHSYPYYGAAYPAAPSNDIIYGTYEAQTPKAGPEAGD
jgi:succinoglycan biosynthesis transport protein ExoP